MEVSGGLRVSSQMLMDKADITVREDLLKCLIFYNVR